MLTLAPAPAKATSSGAEPSKRRDRIQDGSVTQQALRSCVACHARKVRCDKSTPCSKCVERRTDCVFPNVKKPRKEANKRDNSELSLRLHKLEGLVKNLSARHGEDGSVTPPVDEMLVKEDHFSTRTSRRPSKAEDMSSASERSSIDDGLGRLVVNDGRTRYVPNQLWARMGEEITEMHGLLDAPSEEEEEEEEKPLPQPSNRPLEHLSAVNQGFLFGHAPSMDDLADLEPSPSHVFILWEVFKENVDPLVRVLHRPSIESMLIKASGKPNNLSRAAEALFFAIYLGAVVSLDSVQCGSLFHCTKEALINQYRMATEKALARAGFLTSSNLMVLQAFVIFLVCLGQRDDTRLTCALSGLAFNLARALGVHRDGTHFSISPFETEMRRRLWWQISILETRSSEDHGMDSTFSDDSSDTKMPVNVNDEDIHPAMNGWPQVREGCTEMTVCLIRFELAATARRLNSLGFGEAAACSGEKTLELKERIIDECHQRLEQVYLRHMDIKVP